MGLLGDKFKGKPNRYLTGCVERVKRVIHKYQESLTECQNCCVDIGNEFIGHFTGEDPYATDFQGYNPFILDSPCPCAHGGYGQYGGQHGG